MTGKLLSGCVKEMGRDREGNTAEAGQEKREREKGGSRAEAAGSLIKLQFHSCNIL